MLEDEHDARLSALAARARDEMERVEAFGRVWLDAPARASAFDYNVVICGAGMSGLAVAFGLKRRGVRGVALIDQRERGAEGPWLTCARMKTLRSPKSLAGPDLGLPSLTPRSWFEAKYGEAAWGPLDRIGREDWMDYLCWFREMTGPEVHNSCRLVAIRPEGDGLALTLEGGDLPREIRCRRLVIATGLEGSGAARIPEAVRTLPKRLWTHSAEPRPDPEFRDREFVVLGVGASGFDWAVTALEGGARAVTVVARSADLGRTEVLDWTNFPGFLAHMPDLPDAERRRFAHLYFSFKTPPTQDQFDRVVNHRNARLALGRQIETIEAVGERIRLQTHEGPIEADHLLLGVGYEMNLAAREETRGLAPHIAFWRDRAPPGPEETPASAAFLDAHPYLGRGFELTPRDEARDSWTRRIHLFNNTAIASLGPISNGVTGMKYGAPRLADAVSGSLFREQAGRFADALAAYRHPHFDPRGHAES